MSDELSRIERKIDIKFDTLNKTLLSMTKQITTHKVMIDNCEDDKVLLQEAIHGNGKDGLILEVDRIKNTLKTTGIIKRGIWTNVGTIFMCVGVTAAILFSILSYTKDNDSNQQIVKKSKNNDFKRIKH